MVVLGLILLDQTAANESGEQPFAHLSVDSLQHVRVKLRFMKIYFFRNPRSKHAVDHDRMKT
ncbi:MAG: hypothetical protein D4S02_13110 [Rhodocyclaceae bacterium]|nr:MAG: hypothetical protein D4S02_13110 [Rhodocyclaceae bacterium]